MQPSLPNLLPRSHLRYNFKILPAHQTQNLEQTLYQSPNKNLTLWPKLIFQICTKLLSACFSSSTSTTVALQQVLSCYLHTPGSHQSSLLNRSESVSQSVREQVSDKGKQRLDSGPIKKSWAHLIKNLSWPLEKQKDFEQFFLGLDYSCKYTHNKMSNQETEDVLYWRLGILNCTWCHDIKRWERNQLGMVESTFELQLLTTSWSLWILNRNTEMN